NQQLQIADEREVRMRSLAMGLVSLMVLAPAARTEVAPWGIPRPESQVADAVPIRLGRPEPIIAAPEETPPPSEPSVHPSHASPIIRCQADIPPGAPPPPPPPPGGGVPPFPGG